MNVVNVCLVLEHILNTIVDMVSESMHAVFVSVCFGALGEGSPRGRNVDSDR